MLSAPRKTWESWHWFWAKVFGRRMPTSGERAHIGNLLVTYKPDGQSIADWTASGMGTDARHVIRIGDLWIFDYGDTPIETYDAPYADGPLELGPHNKLLAENKRTYRAPGA